ncbi:phage virion morphogenesis protein [Burkholderia glumae]|uniref:Phage virion morphogenesis protein n=1 Tax=Burkholderia glumae TaxID=337 RepID=A0AAQ0BTF4_BURGL|nr:phage virion morphogenesis protein [Burkholderia glumae]ACR32488.1 virion morphogenesis protein [Burkholderia glumae BGR1]AJY64656.1 phage virion morphogenesis family protein [Burkholderia glumae LMG 2196 = ATCC 33617]KHJ64037.1 virion morphogenesis protein [Burkholderia glumae]MCM2484310.1 phage virion morphogenesis protein [Burkholderia glumae]MCM2510001.1 phage virion morphogenesis protein [Burkholderia glumae]
MNGVSVQWDFAGDDALCRHLAAIGGATFTGGHEEIGEYMLGHIQDRFDQQMLWDGSPMPQSAAALERQGPTLIDSRALYDSYVYNVIPDGLEFGNGEECERIHHFGGDTGRDRSVHIEARPVLGVNDHDGALTGQMPLDAVRMR